MFTAGNNLINMGITNILPEGRRHFAYFLMFSWITVLFHQFCIISATESCITLLIFTCSSQFLLLTGLFGEYPVCKHPTQACVSHLIAIFMTERC